MGEDLFLAILGGLLFGRTTGHGQIKPVWLYLCNYTLKNNFWVRVQFAVACTQNCKSRFSGDARLHFLQTAGIITRDNIIHGKDIYIMTIVEWEV